MLTEKKAAIIDLWENYLYYICKVITNIRIFFRKINKSYKFSDRQPYYSPMNSGLKERL